MNIDEKAWDAACTAYCNAKVGSHGEIVVEDLVKLTIETYLEAAKQPTLLNPDMPAQELRMHVGEMTAQEERTARAVIRWANSRIMGGGSATLAPVSAETVPPITPAKQQPSPPVADARFDAISIDVSTGEHDAHLRAFADMPPVDIMNDKGRRIALFIGELNNDMPDTTALIRQLVEGIKKMRDMCGLRLADKALEAGQAFLEQQEGK